ncbi:MAG: YraN family protein [Clostridia bacterium]|nr:YraN family protein [Clostridia bacterium]
MLKREIGDKGEELAVKYLKKNKYRIIERNFNVPKIGEIDIIAKDKDYLVFVEVRLRKSTSHGTAAETVDVYKQKRIIKAAMTFMKQHDVCDVPARFDVVSVTGDADGEHTIELIKNAFDTN